MHARPRLAARLPARPCRCPRAGLAASLRPDAGVSLEGARSRAKQKPRRARARARVFRGLRTAPHRPPACQSALSLALPRGSNPTRAVSSRRRHEQYSVLVHLHLLVQPASPNSRSWSSAVCSAHSHAQLLRGAALPRRVSTPSSLAHYSRLLMQMKLC